MRLILFIVFTSVSCMGPAGDPLEVVVKDPSGALINKAVVQLIKNGKVQATVQTNQKGEARFNKLSRLVHINSHVEAAGFKAHEQRCPTPLHAQEVSLEIDVIKVDVDVEEAQVRNTNPNSASFSNVLTADQIAQLPDDPKSLKTRSINSPVPARRFALTDSAAANFRRNHRSARFVFVSIRTLRKTTTPASDWST